MIFKGRSKEYVKDRYSHVALLLGFIPVWCKIYYVYGEPIIAEKYYGCPFPAMEETNWIPRPLFYLASGIYGFWLYSGLSVGWDVPALLVILKEIDHG